jgi:phospholipid/cholesterol/gamma-HCH transport system substrate-binding protein
MAEENSRNIRLGVFVLAGTVLLVMALYFIGSKQNLFGSTFRITARFYDVNGLMQGNNVRFAGINIGTVESVDIENDSTVKVTMVIKNKVKGFIKKNSVASVGTDGLMGNKLVNISSSKIASGEIQEGDELVSQRPLEMDAMMRTLDVTNENIKVITGNLREVTSKLNSKKSVLNVITDTIVSGDLKSAVVNLRLMTNQGLMVTGNLKNMTQMMKDGKGTIGALITDTIIGGKLKQTVVNLERFSDTAAIVSGDISYLVRQLKQGKGSLGLLLTDTMVVHNLNRSLKSIDTSANKFSDNMDNLHYSWPFKKGYKKRKKK